MVGDGLLQHLGELGVGVVALVAGREFVDRGPHVGIALGEQSVDVTDLLQLEALTAQCLRLRGIRGEGQGVASDAPDIDTGPRDRRPIGLIRSADRVETTIAVVLRRARRHGRGK